METNKDLAREEKGEEGGGKERREEERRREEEGGGEGGGREEGRLTVFLLACLRIKPSKTAAVGLRTVVHTSCCVGSNTRQRDVLTRAGAVEPQDGILLL